MKSGFFSSLSSFLWIKRLRFFSFKLLLGWLMTPSCSTTCFFFFIPRGYDWLLLLMANCLLCLVFQTREAVFEKKMWDFFCQNFVMGKIFHSSRPTDNSLLISFRLSSDAKKLFNKHWLSIKIGARRAKTCMRCVPILTELPFCIPPLVVGRWH